jgi:hypothetical protein
MVLWVPKTLLLRLTWCFSLGRGFADTHRAAYDYKVFHKVDYLIDNADPHFSPRVMSTRHLWLSSLGLRPAELVEQRQPIGHLIRGHAEIDQTCDIVYPDRAKPFDNAGAVV